jgi:hypothetical protein
VTSAVQTSDVDLRPFLLSAAQLPANAVIDGPHQTTGPLPVYASVPTASPAAYENILLYSASTSSGSGFVQLREVIGDVGSASFASQLLSTLDTDLNEHGCYTSPTDIVPLPGTSPPVSATLSSGGQRGRSEFDATLFAAKGSRLIYLSWGSGITVSPDGSWGKGLPHLPAQPDGAAMARVLKTALADIPD